MDTEDSPWGDVPSRSSSHQNLPQAGDEQESDASKSKPTPSSLKPSTSATPRSPAGRSPRTPRRVEAKATRLESLDDGLGPLGPLGDSAPTPEPVPAPPSKEQNLPLRNARQPPAETASLGDEFDSQGTRPRFPPPVQPPPSGVENTRRQGQPSMSVEQAAKPTFDILVGDPHKVGDLTSSHIVYQVTTKTSSKAYKQGEFTVSRRYRDFLWLYTALHNNNPGVVVPPPPEKQAVGRFDTNFVESRRQALERMLNKTAAHPILQHDSDLKIFLESDSFSADVKHREHKEPGLGESKGMFSSFGIGGSSGGKFIEHDDWFHDRKIYLDALENQLKGLLKAIDTVVAQRKGLADAAGDFSASLHALATVELAPSLSGPLEGLSDIQLRIRELYERQAQQDVLTLGITVDEYIRLIGSVKMAFTQRQKSYHSWHAAESELQKRKTTQEKILRQGKTQQDRLNQLQADVTEGERKCHQARLLFEDMGRLMRAELERFEREKVEDFKSGVETFLEGAVEAQKELIEIWETFLMQLDADEDDQPFFQPQPIQTEPLQSSAKAPTNQDMESQDTPAPSTQDSQRTEDDDDTEDVDGQSQHSVAAAVAAAVTAEQEA